VKTVWIVYDEPPEAVFATQKAAFDFARQGNSGLVFQKLNAGTYILRPRGNDGDPNNWICTVQKFRVQRKGPKMRHTKGPWKIHRWGLDDMCIEITTPHDGNVCELDMLKQDIGGTESGRPAREHLANARLIAAAPTLLESAKQILKKLRRGQPIEPESTQEKMLVAVIEEIEKAETSN